jgi:hypothetical protein
VPRASATLGVKKVSNVDGRNQGFGDKGGPWGFREDKEEGLKRKHERKLDFVSTFKTFLIIKEGVTGLFCTES